MFSNGFPKEWSTLRKLAWLYRTVINAVSAVLKTVTGNPIHITDALAKPVQALSVKLEPIQDLHGYDNPWPAGGGKNLLDMGKMVNAGGQPAGTLNEDGSLTVTTSAVISVQQLLTGELNAGTYTVTNFTENISAYVQIGSNSDYTHAASRGGGTRTFDYDGTSYLRILFTNQPADSTEIYKAQLELGSATSYAPYSNICPIYGHTDADVTRTGKNLFDPSNIRGSNTSFSYNSATDTFTVTGNGNREFFRYKFLAGITYTISCQNVSTSVPPCIIVRNPSGSTSGQKTNYVNSNNPLTISFSEDTFWNVILQAKTAIGDASLGTTFNVQIEVDSTATAYEPFKSSTTYPIPLGQTVYGGTLDVTTGKLTVDRAMVDLGTLTWASISGNRKQCAELANSIAKPASTAEMGNLIAEHYTNVNASDLFSDSSLIGIAVNISGYLIARTSGEEVSGKLVYELATPIEVDLTPIEITTLLGANNLWSDGEMTLVYLADGNASDEEALNILLGGRYVNNHGEDEPTDREALDIVLGGNK